MICVKTAEPIEMQFGILSRVQGFMEHALHGDVDVPQERVWRCLPIEKPLFKVQHVGDRVKG